MERQPALASRRRVAELVGAQRVTELVDRESEEKGEGEGGQADQARDRVGLNLVEQDEKQSDCLRPESAGLLHGFLAHNETGRAASSRSTVDLTLVWELHLVAAAPASTATTAATTSATTTTAARTAARLAL